MKQTCKAVKHLTSSTTVLSPCAIVLCCAHKPSLSRIDPAPPGCRPGSTQHLVEALHDRACHAWHSEAHQVLHLQAKQACSVTTPV